MSGLMELVLTLGANRRISHLMIVVAILLVMFAGAVAACLLNGFTTYLIARRTHRSPWMWTALAVVPGVNVVSSWWFYLSTALRLLDDVERLKMSGEFGDARPPG
jgi:hypothetical protein